MRIEMPDLGEGGACSLFYCTEPTTINLIEAAAPDFRFFIEIIGTTA